MNGNARIAAGNPLAQKIFLLNQYKPKEVCNTMQKSIVGVAGGNWGYNKGLDNFHLNVEEVTTILNEANHNKYNLLLNIGLLPDGSIHPEDFRTLSNLLKK